MKLTSSEGEMWSGRGEKEGTQMRENEKKNSGRSNHVLLGILKLTTNHTHSK